MNEKAFNRKLRKNFRRIRLVSFESCGIADVPDLFCQARGHSFWMEGKIKANANSLIPWRPGQQLWALNLLRWGGIYFVICYLSSDDAVQIFRSRIQHDRLIISPALRPIRAWSYEAVEEALLKLLLRERPDTR